MHIRCIHIHSLMFSTHIMHLNDHRFYFVFCFGLFLFSCSCFSFQELVSRMHIACSSKSWATTFCLLLLFKLCVGRVRREEKLHICLCFLGAFSVFSFSLSLSSAHSFAYFSFSLERQRKKICLHLFCPSTNLYCSTDRALHDFVCRWRVKYKQRIEIKCKRLEETKQELTLLTGTSGPWRVTFSMELCVNLWQSTKLTEVSLKRKPQRLI